MEDVVEVDERFAEYFANWGIRLPAGAIQRKEPGAILQDGWTIHYVFGSESGDFYLEFYATHRMTNDRRQRIYRSGETRSLDALETMYGFDSKIPGDRERAERKNRERNVRVAEELNALGLYPSGNINAYLATHDVPPPGGIRYEGERSEKRGADMVEPDATTWFASSGMSHYREKVLEHTFIAELLQHCAFARPGRLKVDVLHAEVDEGGYDLVLMAKGRTRHVQLKSTVVGASKKQVRVNAVLANYAEWCVIWFDWRVSDVGCLDLSYRWLDSESPGELDHRVDESGNWNLTPTNFEGSEKGPSLDIQAITTRLFRPRIIADSALENDHPR